MSGLSDETKWQVYSTYLSANFFCTGEQPDPSCLELLLRDLGVTLDQVEALIESEATGKPGQPVPSGEVSETGLQGTG